jgi:YAP binding domain
MINFILKLKQLPEKYMMNSVLENFTVLQASFVHLPASGLFAVVFSNEPAENFVEKGNILKVTVADTILLPRFDNMTANL